MLRLLDMDMDADAAAETATDYERLQRARDQLSAVGQDPRGWQLQAVLSRPEFLPLLTEFDIRVDDQETQLRIDDSGCVHVAPPLLAAPEALAVRLRHGLERYAWQQAAQTVGYEGGLWVACVLALHACLAYLRILPGPDRRAALAGLPEELQDVYQRFLGLDASPESEPDRILWLASCLHVLESDPAPTPDDPARAIRLAAAGLTLALPVEELLTKGGDKRLHLVADTALNKYGCSPKPRPWAATFSTCTASSISAPGFQAAENARRAMFTAVMEGRFEQECAKQMSRLRLALHQTLALDPAQGNEIVLTASGTDAELLAVYCATRGEPCDVTNIVISPKEVGSGTVHAAGGRHFDPNPPLGETVLPGAPIDGLSADQIDVVPLEVRDEHGRIRTLTDLDAALRQRVEGAIAAGNFVIVHLLDCSKTGFGGPSFETLCALRQAYPESLAVIVDAAQMRVSRRMLQRYLENGCLVIATGSKFFTGPPFSGALLVPAPLSPVGAARLPRGLGQYCARNDFPALWSELTEGLPCAFNAGLMMRWVAALWEMRAFFSVPAPVRRATFEAFAQRMRHHLEAVPEVIPLPAEVYPRHYEHDEDDWDQIQTIFSFYVRRMDGGARAACLSYDEAVLVYHWLNSDISTLLPARASNRDRELAGQCGHIGQPVRVQGEDGQWCGALRIAVGARLVSRVAYDPALGADREQRLAQQERSARQVLDKIAVICAYWSDLISTGHAGALDSHISEARPDASVPSH